MPIHRFKPSTFHNTIGPHAPVLDIGDGDSVVTETLDAHGFDAVGARPGRGPNPMTGPFMVSGAKLGDGLRVRIDRISLTRSTGWRPSVC